MIFKFAAYQDRRSRRLDPTLDGGEADVEGQKDESALGNEPRSASVVTEAAMILTSLIIANVLLLGIHIGLLLTSRCSAPAKWNLDMERLSNWSPVSNEIDIPIRPKIRSRDLFPSPDVLNIRERTKSEDNAAWDDFDNVRTHIATRADILKLGKDPDKIARLEDSYWGLGDDAYMFQLDVMHQIHCLNLLRQTAFGNKENETRNSMWWSRLSNCVASLLQNLQCHATTEALTMVWREGDDTPSPDLDVNGKCRDFEAIREWDELHAVDSDMFGKMAIPKDAFLWPNSVRRATFDGRRR
ncbi:hypothetical protein P168DRAFT_319555 [Aspergillus campestris IBT 28561]|uniref:Tat pathway signal sequence n=1 Tax=Aspergillus campestris (strain IBT 28561) TaxID=1392248 RepID=A0A2I1CZF1_ASPC2|nr:uncharacterized protein P168DRAFT_319555 [Aspergillus campestris IBT 28561]PKY03007.1 hypothetical protein P168DRAFT_319555 [Aspergillus campestris IBT 28561]